MSRELFARVLKEIDDIAINRIIIGGGEATLHPDFGDFTQRLAKKKKFLSLVTNGQWQDENIPGAIVDSSIDLVEISLDAGGKEKYENSRVGASFDRLAANLERLWSARKKAKSAMMINIRLMIRPSTQKKAGHEYRYLEKFADMVMPQLLLKYRDHSYEHDIFISEQYAENRIPRCKRPFNNFIIKYNGDIPLCAPSYNKQVIGNIDRSSLRELWTGEVINRYRQGILKKDPNLAPQCRGCAGT